MADRRILLSELAVGDLFHARSPNGAKLICLAIFATETTIQARRVTTQEPLEFDRRTGVEISDDGPDCRIDSVTPLPADLRSVIMGIDRKYRAERDPERLKLTGAEIKALVDAGAHYASNPL
jgi:hypothetical protein